MINIEKLYKKNAGDLCEGEKIDLDLFFNPWIFQREKMLDTASGGKAAAQQAHHLVLDEQDLAYEEEILRNPNSIKPWIRYIEHKADAPKNILNLVFERALKELPGSYKLWYNYLKVELLLFIRFN